MAIPIVLATLVLGSCVTLVLGRKSLPVRLAAGAVLILVGAYLGLATYFAHRNWRQDQAFKERVLALTAKAQRVVPDLTAAKGLPPLKQACAGKATADGLVAYFH